MESGSVGLLLSSSQGGKSSNKGEEEVKSSLKKTSHVKFGSLSITSGSLDDLAKANKKRKEEPAETSPD